MLIVIALSASLVHQDSRAVVHCKIYGVALYTAFNITALNYSNLLFCFVFRIQFTLFLADINIFYSFSNKNEGTYTYNLDKF